MNIFKEEKGLTLLEVLLSMTILSIIFLSFMSFFPQMGFINKENNDKGQAINTAKELLVEWKNLESVENFIKSPTSPPPAGYINKDMNYYYFKTVKGSFDVDIKIKIASEMRSAPAKTHLIHLQLKNKRNNVVTETYGYIIVD